MCLFTYDIRRLAYVRVEIGGSYAIYGSELKG